jgi:hypothetical protein
VHEALRSPGRPLDAAIRTDMESRFGHDFGRVRVHTDARAAASAGAVDALAYTVGRDVVFGPGQYQPGTAAGRRLLAHELAHTIQQGGAAQTQPAGMAASLASRGAGLTTDGEAEADQAAEAVVQGRRPAALAPGMAGTAGLRLQRQAFGTPRVSVRSPVVEELVTQISTVEAGIHGRPLTSDEQTLASGVFGAGIDYGRVRLIPSPVLAYRTIGNTIRVPENFTIADPYMAETLIHELTHVWQYQHSGTSYISISLGTQIAGTLRTGSRNAAYDYQITPGKSFFEFTPEQQGLIVQNYFAMTRDQAAIPADLAAGGAPSYRSNHLDSSGNFAFLSATDRQAEIARELPLHEPLMRQMRTALPRPEASLLLDRAQEVMRTPFDDRIPVPQERQIAPIKPLVEIRF